MCEPTPHRDVPVLAVLARAAVAVGGAGLFALMLAVPAAHTVLLALAIALTVLFAAVAVTEPSRRRAARYRSVTEPAGPVAVGLSVLEPPPAPVVRPRPVTALTRPALSAPRHVPVIEPSAVHTREGIIR